MAVLSMIFFFWGGGGLHWSGANTHLENTAVKHSSNDLKYLSTVQHLCHFNVLTVLTVKTDRTTLT